jgi:hypothetical protein
MVKIFATTTQKIRPSKLPSSVLLGVGRLVRAFADIEDSLDIHLCRLASIKEAAAVVLLGRSSISAKVEKALAMARLHNKQMEQLTQALFADSSFKEAKHCRNAVAHGVLLGQWGTPRHFAFLTSTQLDPSEFNMRREVVSFTIQDVQEYARFAELRSLEISKNLHLSEWRTARFHQSLLPHRKGKKRELK